MKTSFQLPCGIQVAHLTLGSPPTIDALCHANKQQGQFPSAGGKRGASLLQQKDSQLWLAGWQALCNRYHTTITLVNGLRRFSNMRASEE